MKEQRIFIAGHTGMVGSAIFRQLQKDSSNIIITASRGDLDLVNQQAVDSFFAENKFDQVYLTAAKVGGIYANNKYPADFIYQNLMIEANVIHAAHNNNIPKLLFVGSSCIYPKLAQQPMSEEDLLTGILESTNEPYAIAKIAGIKLCESYNRQYERDYRSVMPTNLYGPNDNFHPDNAHVIPALLCRFHNAKLNNDDTVTVWGTGDPLREFMYVDEMAEASIHVMNLDLEIYQAKTHMMLSHINLGTGTECTIRELALKIANIIGFKGRVEFDASKPDGTPRKLMNVGLLEKLGWKSKINLDEGLVKTYKWFLASRNNLRK